jgi:hypothetical protein
MAQGDFWSRFSKTVCLVCGEPMYKHSRREFNRCMATPLPITLTEEGRRRARG